MYIKIAEHTQHKEAIHNSPFTTAHLDHISSLYGPGAVGCWLLTVVSCLISWTLPKKSHGLMPRRGRSRDSIDNDFIATLALPVIAAGHLIAQTKRHDGDAGGATFLAIDDGARLFQYMAEVEAAAYVVEVGIVIVYLLLGLAIINLRWKRIAFSFPVALFCEIALQRVLFRVNHWRAATGIQTYFDWLLSQNSSVLYGICTFYISLFYFILLYPLARQKFRDVDSLSDACRFMAWMVIASWATIAHMMQRLSPFFSASERVPPQRECWDAFSRQLWRYIPRTNHSIQDLDQAVALFAGCSVLAFRFYETRVYLLVSDKINRQIRTLYELIRNNFRPANFSMELGSPRGD
jgi:hypothetical protein